MVAYGVPFQPSVVDWLRRLGYLICPHSVALIDTVESTRRGQRKRAGQLREWFQIVCVFHCGHLCPPRSGLDYCPERCRFLQAAVQCHPARWSLQWLVHSLQAALLRDITVLSGGPMHAVLGIAYVGAIWGPNCLTSALPRHCQLWHQLHDYMAITPHVASWHRLPHDAPGVVI